MKRAIVLGVLLSAGLLSMGVAAWRAPSAAGQPNQQAPTAAALQVDKVTDTLFVLRGGGGNTAVFITSGGVVLVDTKITGWGQPILERVKELTDKPITTIINTHTHYDHVEGNVELPMVEEIIAHENTAKLMSEMRPVTGIQTPDRNVFEANDGRGLPTRTFRDRLTVGSGDDRIELRYFGRAHTGGDAFVIFPVARAIHMGDVFPSKGMPIMDANNGGSGVEYPETVASVAALPNIDTVIAGHHATTLTMADVKEYAEFTRAFLEAVREARQAGRTVDDVAASWKVPARFEGYAQPQPARLRSNAQVIWDELR